MTLEDSSDLDLLDAWVDRKDIKAGDHLIRRHLQSLKRFFSTKISDDETKNELVQKTLLECTRSVAKFRKDASFRTYLLSIARNVLLHHYRSRVRKDDKVDPLTHSVANLNTGTFTKLAREEDRNAIREALQRLPLDFQIVLELKYRENMTAAECALVLGIPANTVSGRLRRGKLRLKKILDEMKAKGSAGADLDIEQRVRGAFTDPSKKS